MPWSVTWPASQSVALAAAFLCPALPRPSLVSCPSPSCPLFRFPGWQTPQYKLEGDLVHLRGSAHGAALAAMTAGLVVAVLPEAARPEKHATFSTRGGAASKARTDIRLEGTIVVVAFDGLVDSLFLDGISYSVARDGWTALQLRQEWGVRASRTIW